MEATNKEVIFTRPHKTIYAAGDKIIKIFDERYTKADVLNEARNEALVEENTDLNIPALLEVSHTEEGWCPVREKVAGKTLEQLMQEEPEKLETYMERFVDLQLDVHKQKIDFSYQNLGAFRYFHACHFRNLISGLPYNLRVQGTVDQNGMAYLIQFLRL